MRLGSVVGRLRRWSVRLLGGIAVTMFALAGVLTVVVTAVSTAGE